tara:strand:+ start:181 stop:642 length:462 start_codon:yes stop_codon:yes gene_type:complete
LKNFSVRLATDKDSKNIFDWRNDTLTRSMSHSNKIINWKEHKQWYASSLNSEDRLLIICEYDIFNKIAVVRFDLNESGVLISINLNPNKRGKNLGKESLIKSIEFFSKKYPSTKKIFAEVKEENIASKKTFLGAGFEKFKVENHIGYYLKNLI